MRVLLLVDDMHVVELDVKVLIYRVQYPRDGQIVFQFYRDFFANQGLEVGIEKHRLKVREYRQGSLIISTASNVIHFLL